MLKTYKTLNTLKIYLLSKRNQNIYNFRTSFNFGCGFVSPIFKTVLKIRYFYQYQYNSLIYKK